MKPEKFLREFFRPWESTNGYRQALPQFMTSDCEYEIVGFSSTVGPDQTVSFLDQLAIDTGIASRLVEFKHVTEQKGNLFVERLDHFFDNKGRRQGSVRVMSIMRVEGNALGSWRDYLDTRCFRNPQS